MVNLYLTGFCSARGLMGVQGWPLIINITRWRWKFRFPMGPLLTHQRVLFITVRLGWKSPFPNRLPLILPDWEGRSALLLLLMLPPLTPWAWELVYLRLSGCKSPDFACSDTISVRKRKSTSLPSRDEGSNSLLNLL